MAKVVFGGGVVSMSGKIAGSVFSRNKGGAYVRAKVKPSNPKSNAQTLVRGMMAMISQAWRGLTAPVILQWNTAAKADASVKKNGHTSELSGHQYHQQLNRNILEIGGTVITTPPLRTAIVEVGTLSATAAHATPALSVNFSPAIPVGQKVILSATAAVSPGKSNLNTRYRKIAILSSTDTAPFDAMAAYVAKFGSIGAAGLRIGIKMRPVITANGIGGIGVTTDLIIAT